MKKKKTKQRRKNFSFSFNYLFFKGEPALVDILIKMKIFEPLLSLISFHKIEIQIKSTNVLRNLTFRNGKKQKQLKKDRKKEKREKNEKRKEQKQKRKRKKEKNMNSEMKTPNEQITIEEKKNLIFPYFRFLTIHSNRTKNDSSFGWNYFSYKHN